MGLIGYNTIAKFIYDYIKFSVKIQKNIAIT